ncbi:MAG: hypothetical protein A2075_18945 [Geobacteraceae bacterium GWC2_58_44]|nr:MAG: hypothetical protein A2075_18945 [Geobacteraceae bacterium GWC2_58_44]HBG07886.1 hypothetical protein [Geobacter sp.]
MSQVAIIIPCHNSVSLIGRTLDSIFSQSYDKFRLYVVDDNSNDGTADILHCNRHRLQVLHHEGNANKGASESINLGILNSESEYVALCDHDDVWYENKLKEQMQFLELNKDVGLVYSDGYVIDEHDRRLHSLLPKQHTENGCPSTLLLNNYIRTPSSVMIRRKIFESVGLFNVNLRFSHDHDMWLRICEKHKIGYLDAVHLGYRQHSQQNCRKKDLWTEGFDILNDAVARYPYDKVSQRKRLAVLNYRIGLFEIRNHEPGKGICHLLQAFSLDPSRSIEHLLNKACAGLR